MIDIFRIFKDFKNFLKHFNTMEEIHGLPPIEMFIISIIILIRNDYSYQNQTISK